MSDINWDETDYLFALKNKEKSLVEFFEYKPSTSNCEECWMVSTSETLYLKGPWVLFEKTVTKPIYTQAMCDAGELPLVGMECQYTSTFFTLKTFNYGECKIIAYHKEKVWLEVGTSEYVLSLDAVKFKPLTPPIELIDGSPYMFDYNDFKRIGFYGAGMNLFTDTVSSWNPELCRNIVLLTPEGEE